ncbi:unnamed protein product [Camellia sinensis]
MFFCSFPRRHLRRLHRRPHHLPTWHPLLDCPVAWFHRGLFITQVFHQWHVNIGVWKASRTLSATHNPNSLHGSSPPPRNKFYLNRLQTMGHGSLDHHDVVSLPELLYPVESLSQIFIATFRSDILWFLSYCDIPTHLCCQSHLPTCDIPD